MATTLGNKGVLKAGKSLPQRRAHQLVIQYQMVINTCKIIQTEQMEFVYLEIHMCAYVHTHTNTHTCTYM